MAINYNVLSSDIIEPGIQAAQSDHTISKEIQSALWKLLSLEAQRALLRNYPLVRAMFRTHPMNAKLSMILPKAQKQIKNLFPLEGSILKGFDYLYLSRIKTRLIGKLAEIKISKFDNDILFDEKLASYLNRIDAIKLYLSDNSDVNKTVLTDSQHNSIMFCKNEGYHWGSPEEMNNFEQEIDAIIDGVKDDFDLSEREATELIFLRKGFGRYGTILVNGNRSSCAVGVFAFSRVREGWVRCLYWTDGEIGRKSQRSNVARPTMMK